MGIQEQTDVLLQRLNRPSTRRGDPRRMEMPTVLCEHNNYRDHIWRWKCYVHISVYHSLHTHINFSYSSSQNDRTIIIIIRRQYPLVDFYSLCH